LPIHREIGNLRGEGILLGNLGAAYADLGETRGAIQLHEHSLVIARKIGDRRLEAQALANMSLELYKLGERAKALTLAEQAIPILEEIEDPNQATLREQLRLWRKEAG